MPKLNTFLVILALVLSLGIANDNLIKLSDGAKCGYGSSWGFVNYSSANVPDPVLNANGIRANQHSCVSFPIKFIDESSILINAFIQVSSKDSGIEVLLFENGISSPYKSYIYKPVADDFESGWYTLKIPIDFSSLKKISIVGYSLEKEFVIIDSIQYAQANQIRSENDFPLLAPKEIISEVSLYKNRSYNIHHTRTKDDSNIKHEHGKNNENAIQSSKENEVLSNNEKGREAIDNIKYLSRNDDVDENNQGNESNDEEDNASEAEGNYGDDEEGNDHNGEGDANVEEAEGENKNGEGDGNGGDEENNENGKGGNVEDASNYNGEGEGNGDGEENDDNGNEAGNGGNDEDAENDDIEDEDGNGGEQEGEGDDENDEGDERVGEEDDDNEAEDENGGEEEGEEDDENDEGDENEDESEDEKDDDNEDEAEDGNGGEEEGDEDEEKEEDQEDDDSEAEDGNGGDEEGEEEEEEDDENEEEDENGGDEDEEDEGGDENGGDEEDEDSGENGDGNSDEEEEDEIEGPDEEASTVEDKGFWNVLTISIVSVGGALVLIIIITGAYYAGTLKSKPVVVLEDIEPPKTMIIPRVKDVYNNGPSTVINMN